MKLYRCKCTSRISTNSYFSMAKMEGFEERSWVGKPHVCVHVLLMVSTGTYICKGLGTRCRQKLCGSSSVQIPDLIAPHFTHSLVPSQSRLYFPSIAHPTSRHSQSSKTAFYTSHLHCFSRITSISPSLSEYHFTYQVKEAH